MPVNQFDEQEFSGKLTGKVFGRIASLLKPYWHWNVGFLISLIAVSVLDPYFT